MEREQRWPFPCVLEALHVASLPALMVVGLLWTSFSTGSSQSRPLDDFQKVRASGAGLVARFGDLYSQLGKWPVVGVLPFWSRNQWPVPAVVRDDSTSDRV